MRKDKLPRRFSVLVILASAVVLVIILMIKSLNDINSQPVYIKVILDLFELIGLTGMVSGFFTLWMQLKEWKDYFENALKSLVIDQSYLETLDKVALDHMRLKALRAFYNNENIDKDGSFLNYLEDNLNHLVVTPFRDDVLTEIHLFDVEDDGYWLSDRISYVCRRGSSNDIQEFVTWVSNDSEIIDFKEMEICVYDEQGGSSTLFKVRGENGQIFVNDDSPISLDDFLKTRIECPLDARIDGLKVDLKTKYKVDKSNFGYWTMAHPTKSFKITINCPTEYDIQFQSLVPHQESAIVHSGPGHYSMRYNNWLLPNNGVVYSFIKRT